MKQIQHIYPLDQSYKVSLFSRCENDYIRGSGEIKQIQSISANICLVFTKHFSLPIQCMKICLCLMLRGLVMTHATEMQARPGERCMNGHG